jgi:ketosteroid isomerase-like protein
VRSESEEKVFREKFFFETDASRLRTFVRWVTAFNARELRDANYAWHKVGEQRASNPQQAGATHMIDAKWARDLAQEWIDAWNAHDIERILSHYSDDFEMRSPFIIERMGIASGVLEGKQAVRVYWERALAASSPVRFELLDVTVGVDAIALYYWNESRGRNVIEVLTVNAQGQIVSGAALYAIA